MSVNAMFEGCGRDNKTERDFEKCDIEAKLVGSTSHTHHVHGHDMLPADWSAKCRPCEQISLAFGGTDHYVPFRTIYNTEITDVE